ncbi:MAG: V-type ATP synthase subunit E [Planctomycetota bacterium]|jgi:V/A-type H+-transporting ATPase subunit E
MDSVEKEKAVLITSIESDARAEAEQIVAEAEKKAAEKRKYAEKRIESTLNDAGQKAAEQAEAAKRKVVSGAEIEAKRRSMHARDAVMREITDLAEEKLRSMVGIAGYADILTGWLIEAAIGLDAESASVNASQKELALIDQSMLSKVSKEVQTQTGKNVNLRLSDEQPLSSQGVVLTAADGRTAFNNQVRTRMLRNQRQIRTEIYNALFSDVGKEES